MANKTNVLGVNIDVITMECAVETVLDFFEENSVKTIYTVGPEIAMYARKDAAYAEMLNAGDLVTPDGVGVVYASKLNKTKLTQRVGGCDLCTQLFIKMAELGKKAYFLGGAPGIAEKAKTNVECDFPGLKIVGVNDGFFYDEKGNIIVEKEKLIIENINQLQPDLLLVGTGAPKQERWISANKNKLNCRVVIGVGGSLDIYAGNVKRASKFWVKLNLEWLYRLLSEPRKRLKRQLKLPLFVLAVIGSKIFKKNRG